ncbi:MAG: sulfatase-like hydrolase/transferase [Bacteroidota bacterium]
MQKNYYFLLLGLLFWGGCEALNPPKTFDNVLFIISDDLATHAVGCYGNEIIRTPNIDALAAEGVRFERAYATSPMCTPSRASLMTGLYPHAAGVTLLQTPLPDSTLTIAEYLKEQGFATGIFGKHHFNSNRKHGFDTLVNNAQHNAFLASATQKSVPQSVKVRPEWKPFQDSAKIWLNAEGATSGNWYDFAQGTFFAKSGVEFMKRHKEERFFAVISFREPHSPFSFPNDYADAYNPEDMPLAQGTEADKKFMPEVFKDLSDEEKRGIIRSYYSSVEYMDRNVGYVLDELKNLGLAENTLVVFVGDHGYLLNHHGRFEKHMMWEEAITTPLIIRGYDAGASVEQPISLVDLVPTMVASLGLAPMPERQGLALQPLLQGVKVKLHDFIFAEYLEDNKAMITDGEYKYIFTSGKKDLGSGYATGNEPTGLDHRLYHLKSDPHETNNLIMQPEHAPRVDRLMMSMTYIFRKTHPFSNQVMVTLALPSQLKRFVEPVDGYGRPEGPQSGNQKKK